VAEESDKTHRLLFGFASMVEQLIRRCLPGPWIERFDFSTLAPRSERQLTDQGEVRRDSDLFWRLLYRPEEGEPYWVHLNLEHSSTRSRWAALNLTTYQVMDWQKQARSGKVKRGEQLYPTISMMVYTGDGRMKAKSLREIVRQMEPAPPGTDLGDFVLLDVQRQTVAEVTTTFDAFLKLHQLKSFEEVADVVQHLGPLVSDDEKLAQAFLGLVNDEILRRMARKGEKTVRLNSLEDTTMLAQRIDRIRDGYIKQGKLEGEREEAARLFLKLFAVKNGTSVPSDVRKRAGSAKLKQLETWAERLLTVERAEDVFQDG